MSDIDYLHGIVRYILGKSTDEGKAVIAAADRIEELEGECDNLRYTNDFCGRRIKELEAAFTAMRTIAGCQQLAEVLKDEPGIVEALGEDKNG